GVPTILFVEDDPAAARSLRFVRANADHEVEWIATGGEGLNCFDALRPDLLVLDVSLPDVSDYEICAEIGRRSQTPIRFVFAHVHDDDIIRGFQAGADDYITKPFSPRALAVRIEALLRR